MKVVFLEDVYGVAKGGDFKEVKNGFESYFEFEIGLQSYF